MKNLVFLDTETTGLDPDQHEIIEISIIRESSPGVVDVWSTKIKPQHIERADPKALEINGYNPGDWSDAPVFADVAQEIKNRLSKCIIVGHNVGFDVGFVRAEIKRTDLDPRISFRHMDTVTLAYEHLYPLGLRSVALDAIRDFFEWSREGAHTAERDAQDVRRLYHMLCRASCFKRWWWKLRYASRL